jgi:sulfur carrier protein
MKITLNGQIHEATQGATVRELLLQIGLGDRPVVVEHNKQALLPKQHVTTAINDGDVVEVVQITAGG